MGVAFLMRFDTAVSRVGVGARNCPKRRGAVPSRAAGGCGGACGGGVRGGRGGAGRADRHAHAQAHARARAQAASRARLPETGMAAGVCARARAGVPRRPAGGRRGSAGGIPAREREASRARGWARARVASRACAVVERDYEPIHVAIDCGYSQDSARALHSVGKQLSMIVGTNRRARRPARLHATSFAGDVAASVRQKHAIDAWQDMDTHADAFTEVPELLDAAGGDLNNFVYMSPDGEEVLTGEVESGVVYVFAGLIDVNPPTPNISRARAEALGVRTARLPVREFYPGASATVMSIVSAVECVLTKQTTASWEEVMEIAVPNRIKEARKTRYKRRKGVA